MKWFCKHTFLSSYDNLCVIDTYWLLHKTIKGIYRTWLNGYIYHKTSAYIESLSCKLSSYRLFWKRLKGLLIRPFTNENKTLSSIESNFWFIFKRTCLCLYGHTKYDLSNYIAKLYHICLKLLIMIFCSKNTQCTWSTNSYI